MLFMCFKENFDQFSLTLGSVWIVQDWVSLYLLKEKVNR